MTETGPRFFLMIPEVLNGTKIVASKSLTSTDKLVFEEIFTILNQHRQFFMSNNTLAKRLGMSSSSIKHSIKHLKDNDLISTQNKSDGKVITGRTISLFNGSHKNQGGSNNVHNVVHILPKGSSNMNTNISTNKSINKSSDEKQQRKALVSNELADYFPRYYNSAYKMDKLDADTNKLLKSNSFKDVQKAINETNKYQMKGNFVNCPPRFIEVAIDHLKKKRVQQPKDTFIDSTNVDIWKRAKEQTKRAKARLLKRKGEQNARK